MEILYKNLKNLKQKNIDERTIFKNCLKILIKNVFFCFCFCFFSFINLFYVIFSKILSNQELIFEIYFKKYKIKQNKGKLYRKKFIIKTHDVSTVLTVIFRYERDNAENTLYIRYYRKSK